MDSQDTSAQTRHHMVMCLGTNNWQRTITCSDGVETIEFAPGSGILHETHHHAFNAIPNAISCSMYPSMTQTLSEQDVHIFKLPHPIPICESVGPNSS